MYTGQRLSISALNSLKASIRVEAIETASGTSKYIAAAPAYDDTGTGAGAVDGAGADVGESWAAGDERMPCARLVPNTYIVIAPYESRAGPSSALGRDVDKAKAKGSDEDADAAAAAAAADLESSLLREMAAFRAALVTASSEISLQVLPQWARDEDTSFDRRLGRIGEGKGEEAHRDEYTCFVSKSYYHAIRAKAKVKAKVKCTHLSLRSL